MNLTDLISGGIGNQATEGISQKLGLDKNQTQWVIAAAVPLMMSALKYNANKSPEKAEGIQQALSSKHNGNIFDSLGSLFNNGPTEEEDKIVNHIFGKNTDTVKESLAEKSGINIGKIGGILALIAPLVMGYLGKQKQNQDPQQESSGGLGDLLGNILGGGSSQSNSGPLGGIGDLIGSVLGGGSSSNESKPSLGGGIGDLVGDFFNQKNDKSAKGSILDSLAGMFSK
ncbi:DUF937 domain-containing protein [Sphingobacterium sp. HJSM2_6]|uniref:DUF937 domain-containing protein n=1 Tax=Sphingobacterium sp. HJSM2_6 TaxID=3366264 RepID=UPI003BD8A6CB